jgi:hypothetical protein
MSLTTSVMSKCGNKKLKGLFGNKKVATAVLQIRMDPHHFGKLDPDPHQSGKLDSDTDPHQSEKQVLDPHQSEKMEALEGHFGALECPNL